MFLSGRIYVFSPRPATVIRELTVDLPRPRTVRTLADPAFTRGEADLLGTLLAEAA